jgi:putative transposase
MEEVAAGVGDADMNLLDAGFRLFPVVAEFHLATHRLLLLAQGCFVPLEAVERGNERAVRESGESGNAHVDTDRATLRHGLLDLARGLDAHEPFAAPMAHGDVFHPAQRLPAVAVAQPAELGQQDAVVVLLQFDLFRVGVAEAVRLAFLLEAREAGPLGEEVGIRALQVLERLLQRVDGRISQPRCVRAVAPFGEQLAQARITELLLTLLVAFFLQRQRLVEHEPARSGEAAHLALLFAGWHQFVLEGLESLHNDMRHGRHCVFKMHVHLVFVSKYRRDVFDGDAINRLRTMFAKVCADFEAQLIEMDGEDDHVHLLVEYPPKVAVSNLVNSLKGVSSRLLRKERPDIQKRYWRGVLWSPSYFASSCGGAPISIVRQYIEQQQTPH